jgi:hypothetical protein
MEDVKYIMLLKKGGEYPNGGCGGTVADRNIKNQTD